MEIHITMLPSEILLKIFSFFDARNLLDAEKYVINGNNYQIRLFFGKHFVQRNKKEQPNS